MELVLIWMFSEWGKSCNAFDILFLQSSNTYFCRFAMAPDAHEQKWRARNVYVDRHSRWHLGQPEKRGCWEYVPKHKCTVRVCRASYVIHQLRFPFYPRRCLTTALNPPSRDAGACNSRDVGVDPRKPGAIRTRQWQSQRLRDLWGRSAVKGVWRLGPKAWAGCA